MSRVSLSRRLGAVLAAAERVDPIATAVYRMQPATRLRHGIWRSECNTIINGMGGGEALYAHYVETGEWLLPDPPRCVAEALGITDAAPVLTDDLSAADVAAIYADTVEA